jgi:hypothetical protein
MSNNWSRVMHTTIADYIKGEEVNVLRNRKLLALMKSRGRISMNHGGTSMIWQVRAKRAPINGYADGDTLTFPRHERWKKAELDWRGYSATDSATKMEQVQNKGAAQIINLFSNISKLLMEDVEEHFGDELYIDGNGSGNGKRMHGIESWFGNSGGAAAGYVATPSDTYAGLETSLGYYGGSWSVNGSSQVEWPIGTGDAVYDFWSPLIIDYTDSVWGGTATWAANALAATRFAITHQGRNKSLKSMQDLFLYNPELFRLFLDAIGGKENLFIRRGEKVGLVALGFTDVINWDGMDITREYGVPSNTGYGLAIEQIELCSLQSQLFVPDGPDWDIATRSWRFAIDMLGNMKANPRYQTKFKNVS